MRLAVISDIHGNLEAFLEVLKDLDRERPDRVISLGDNVGYGAQPEEVLELIRARRIPSIIGNHELAVAGLVDRTWFNPSSLQSLDITKGLISESSHRFIRTLPVNEVVGRALCVHGFPPDSALTYLFQVDDAGLEAALQNLEQPICFVGHTHELVKVFYDGRTFDREELSCGRIRLEPHGKYLVNVGSVGQPRDGDNRAKYVIWDDRSHTLDVRCIPYDFESAARKILQRGFPRINAQRLRTG